MSAFVRAVDDKDEFLQLMLTLWGSHSMMVGLNVYDCADLDLLGIFDAADAAMAYASWTLRDDVAVLCVLHAVAPGQGAALQLLDAVKDAARARGAVRMRALLTNDNMPGMAFYQRQGFRFSALYVEAIDAFRSVIPTIIRTGYMDIPVRDTLELEIVL